MQNLSSRDSSTTLLIEIMIFIDERLFGGQKRKKGVGQRAN